MGILKRLLFAIPAVLCVAGAAALDLDYATPRLGVLFILNDSGQGAASPIVNIIGCSLSYSFTGGGAWSFDPGFDLFWTQYEWDASGSRAIPTEPETAEASFVIGGILDGPFSYRFRINERLSIKPGAGLAMVLRVPIPNSTSMPGEDNLAIAGWFYGGARFLYPELQALVDVELQDRFAFEFAARTFWPVFNLWTGANFFDHWMFQAALSVRVKLGPPKAAPGPDAVPPGADAQPGAEATPDAVPASPVEGSP
ncbi:MAG: hypothetical protein NT080_02875 [Spirochaetes bacterium]|nr:hypothetical protein [Spirochaetota bacterium]